MPMKPWHSMLADRAAILPFLALQCVVTLTLIRSVRVRRLLDRGGAWRILVGGAFLTSLLVAMVGLRSVNESIPDRVPRRLDPLLVIAFGVTQALLSAAMLWSARRRGIAANSSESIRAHHKH